MADSLPPIDAADSILDLIGHTPLVRLPRVCSGEDIQCTLVAKLETTNPGGSVKERVAVAMIDAAERDGLLKPGGTIVEPTSGNTGAGLAIVAAQRGYKCIFVMSDKMSDEKVALLRAYGAEVVVCPTAVPPEDPRSYYSTAERLVRETPGAFRPDQYSNQANPLAHERTTGPEIWEQTRGRVTHFVAGIGTGGTITGVGRYLKSQNPAVQIVGADPSGSVYSGGTGRPYLTEGIGEDFWPTTFDPSLVDRVIEVTDADAFTARRVTRDEGLLIGGSGGTAVHAALVVAREARPDDIVVVLIPDSGRGYLSKIYTDAWMFHMGFLRAEGPVAGDILTAKGDAMSPLVLITPDRPVRDAITLMHQTGVSQLVVSVTTELPLALKEVTGTLRELELMDLAYRDPAVLDHPIDEIMDPPMPMIGIGEGVARVVECLDAGPSVLVLDGGHPIGVLTRSDVLGFLATRAGMTAGDGFETRAIDAGQDPDAATGAIVPPISLATTFVQEAVGKHRGYEYSRSGNPTRTAMETCIASLEGARHGLAFASGLAAEDAILRTLEPGDHIIIPNDAYGGTFRLVARVHEPLGIAWTACDFRDLAALEAAWQPETTMIWIESPTNPFLSVVDIEAVAKLAHARQVRVVVDNTFATPYLQQPLALGAHAAVHSSTKYLGGHSDVVGGFIAVNDAEFADELRFLQNAMGAVPSPFDCYLVLRGVKTLALRMREHCSNAQAIVRMLREHDAVAKVLYPDESEVARRQMRDFGGMVSFLANDEDAALELVTRTRLFSLAESLGAVESLIEHPARMTHASAAGSPLEVDPRLVRLSVGIESQADLVADLKNALDSLAND